MTQLDTYPVASLETPSEPQSFEKVYARYYDRMLHQAARYGSHDPEVSVQNAFERAYKAFDSYEDRGGSHWPWLKQILHNIVMDEHRRENKIHQDPSSDSYTFQVAPDLEAEASIHELEFDIAIVGRIAEVVDENRTQMIQMLATGATYEEIAERLDMKLGTVRSGIKRARDALSADPEIRSLIGKD